MSDQVRLLVGLENLLLKARRRLRECEREEGDADGPKARRYSGLIKRIADEIHSADQRQLQEYLNYLEESLVPRIGLRVEKTKRDMVAAARRIVDGKVHLHELRAEYSDTLERVRSVRERLGLDPFQPLETHFGIGVHSPNADQHTREAFDLVREYLKS